MVHVEHVARARFPEALAAIREILRGASFVAFDTELSGLSAQLEKPSLTDTVDQRYAQMRESAQSFAVVEFGLSCFTWDADARVFRVRTFQFPIFPVFHPSVHNHQRSELPDRSFAVQAKCLTYIRQHGFDLNAWVDEGIGYLSHHEQRQAADVLDKPLREDVTAKFKGDPAAKIRTAESERFLKDMRKRIAVLADLKDTQKAEGAENQDTTALELPTRFLMEKISETRAVIRCDGGGVCWRMFVTEALPPFRRSALLTMAEKEFPSIVVLDCSADNDDDADVKASPWKRRLRLVRTDDEQQKERLRAAHEAITHEELQQRNLSLIGFTALFDLLTEAGKPLVGHNMLLDLMQCYDKFHEPLPASCSAFLHELHTWLGRTSLFDTKLLVEHAMDHVDLFGDRLQHSALEHVYECVSKDPFHGPIVEDSRSSETTTCQTVPLSAHQAGYDAFMTGAVFLRVCSGLGVPNQELARIGAVEDSEDQRPKWKETILRLRNSIKLTQLLPPVMLTRPGPYPKEIEMPSRARFLLMKLTRAWIPKVKPHHIQQSVAWALNLRTPKHVKVRYKDKMSVYIELPSADQADQLLEIRRECKEAKGSDRDPLPSLGCVDLFRMGAGENGDGDAQDDDTMEPISKRHRYSE